MKTMYQQTLDGEVQVIETDNGIEEIRQNPTEELVEDKLGKWEFKEVYSFLFKWMSIFVERFDLLCDDLFQVMPVLEICKMRKNINAIFIPGYTSRGEPYSRICFNSLFVKKAKKWEMLAVLLHELVHSNFYVEYVEYMESKDEKKRMVKHGKKFQEKMLSFGIVVNGRGQHLEYCKTCYALPTKEEKESGQKEGWRKDKNGKNRFYILLKENGIECQEEYTVPLEKKEKKIRIDWKAKYLDMESKLENLQKQINQQDEQTSEKTSEKKLSTKEKEQVATMQKYDFAQKVLEIIQEEKQIDRKKLEKKLVPICNKIAKETKLNSVNSYSFVRLSIAELEGQNKIKSKLDYVTKNYIYFSI